MYLNNYEDMFDPNGINWLTLTWDVFKYSKIIEILYFWIWLTLTWDVFKSIFWIISVIMPKWLTLTWDVFKFRNW